MAKALESSKLPIYCLVDGEAASMGFYVLQGCYYRIMTPTSTLIIHEPFVPLMLNSNRYALKDAETRMTESGEEMITYEVRRMKMTRAEFNSHINGAGKNWYLTSAEALDAGAVDQIVEEADVIRFVQALRALKK